MSLNNEKKNKIKQLTYEGGLIMYKKILLAIDGSDYAMRAAKHAMELAKMTPESSIEIVCVIDQNRGNSEVSKTAYRKAILEEMEQMAKAAQINYEIIFLHGDPGLQIIKHANQQQSDLVVIGSRGLNRLQEFVLGSVSHKIAKQTKCPVLIVK